MRSIICATLLLIGGLSPAMAQTPTGFARQAPVILSGSGPWYRLALPIEAQFTAHHADLRDLRIVNGEGEAVPYSLRTASASQAESPAEIAVRVFPLRGPARETVADSLKVVRSTTGAIIEISPGGTAAGAHEIIRGWLLDASASDFPLQKLMLDWNAPSDGFQRFSLEASDDLISWRTLGEGQLIRLRFNGELIDRNTVELPGHRARYLRLLWLAPQEAATLTGARLSGSLSHRAPPPLVWSPLLPTTPGQNGAYTWSLPLALPLTQVRIPLDQPNTLAPVVMEGRNDAKEPWRPLARDVLYRLPQDGHETRQEILDLPGRPVSQLRLQIDARGGGLGGAAPQLSVGLRTTEVIFLARGSAPYRLLLGSSTVSDGGLPLTTLVPGYDEGKLATMGEARLEGGLQMISTAAAVAPEGGNDWKRVGLWAVLLAGVALLAVMAFSLLRTSKVKP